MSFISTAGLAPVAFAMVFCRSFQQKNVMHNRYAWVIPTSACMALTEALLWINVVNEGLGWGVAWMAVGGGTGCLMAMLFHNKLENKFKREEK